MLGGGRSSLPPVGAWPEASPPSPLLSVALRRWSSLSSENPLMRPKAT